MEYDRVIVVEEYLEPRQHHFKHIEIFRKFKRSWILTIILWLTLLIFALVNLYVFISVKNQAKALENSSVIYPPLESHVYRSLDIQTNETEALQMIRSRKNYIYILSITKKIIIIRTYYDRGKFINEISFAIPRSNCSLALQNAFFDVKEEIIALLLNYYSNSKNTFCQIAVHYNFKLKFWNIFLNDQVSVWSRNIEIAKIDHFWISFAYRNIPDNIYVLHSHLDQNCHLPTIDSRLAIKYLLPVKVESSLIFILVMEQFGKDFNYIWKYNSKTYEKSDIQLKTIISYCVLENGKFLLVEERRKQILFKIFNFEFELLKIEKINRTERIRIFSVTCNEEEDLLFLLTYHKILIHTFFF